MQHYKTVFNGSLHRMGDQDLIGALGYACLKLREYPAVSFTQISQNKWRPIFSDHESVIGRDGTATQLPAELHHYKLSMMVGPEFNQYPILEHPITPTVRWESSARPFDRAHVGNLRRAIGKELGNPEVFFLGQLAFRRNGKPSSMLEDFVQTLKEVQLGERDFEPEREYLSEIAKNLIPRSGSPRAGYGLQSELMRPISAHRSDHNLRTAQGIQQSSVEQFGSPETQEILGTQGNSTLEFPSVGTRQIGN